MNERQNALLEKIWGIIQEQAKHIQILNEEMGEVRTDVKWLKQFFWIVATASVGALVAALFGLILK